MSFFNSKLPVVQEKSNKFLLLPEIQGTKNTQNTEQNTEQKQEQKTVQSSPVNTQKTIQQPVAIPKLQPMTLENTMREATKIYNQANQGGYKTQLQPTIDYIQSQIPEISKQFMTKAYRQNINPESGLGGQIASKLLSDFQTNVLAPVLQQIGTRQSIEAPREQLQLAQNIQQLSREDANKQADYILKGIDSGTIKEEMVSPMLASVYGIPEEYMKKPEVRQGFIDNYIMEATNQGITPDITKLNKYLQAMRMPAVTNEEIAQYGEAVKPKSDEIRISSLISKLSAGQVDENTAASYGIPYVKKGYSWDWEDTPETRSKIRQLYDTNPDFRAWFDSVA